MSCTEARARWGGVQRFVFVCLYVSHLAAKSSLALRFRFNSSFLLLVHCTTFPNRSGFGEMVAKVPVTFTMAQKRPTAEERSRPRRGSSWSRLSMPAVFRAARRHEHCSTEKEVRESPSTSSFRAVSQSLFQSDPDDGLCAPSGLCSSEKKNRYNCRLQLLRLQLFAARHSVPACSSTG